MNLYDAVFLRKSTRSFLMEAVPEDTLKAIGAFYEEVPALFPGIETEIGITENVNGKHQLSGLFGVKAPYYLAIYSEEKDKSDMNAGYVMQQISLFMMTKGLGSCFLGSSELQKTVKTRGNKTFVIMMAFGKPKGALTRRESDARRLAVKDLCEFRDTPRPWMKHVLAAARLAPSAMNQQPWRFLASGKHLHVFSKKKGFGFTSSRWYELEFGIMFANIMVVSEELWLDVDLIRLENISQKNFKQNQYVLTCTAKDLDLDMVRGGGQAAEKSP